MSWWRRIQYEGVELLMVGVLPDGGLFNPNEYPEGLVREAVAAAEARKRERRKLRAQKAAATRSRRRQSEVNLAATRLAQHLSPTVPEKYADVVFVTPFQSDAESAANAGVMSSPSWSE